MRRVIGRVGYATAKVHQLTGERDRERNVACINATEPRYGLFGTDLGSSFEHNGRLWFLFGDTVAANLAYTHVASWRDLKNPADWGVTPATARLLDGTTTSRASARSFARRPVRPLVERSRRFSRSRRCS